MATVKKGAKKTSTKKEVEEPKKASRRVNFDDAVETGKNSDTRLATRNGANGDDEETAVVVRGSYDRPDFSQEDLMTPTLRLAQGMTPEVQSKEAEIGQFVLTGFDALDKVIVVPMTYFKGRELRDADDDNALLCKSMDAAQGVGNPGGDCARCKFAQWGKDKKGAGVPPACTLFYQYGLWSEDHQTMTTIVLKKSSINTARALNTIIARKGWGNVAIELSSRSEKNTKNNSTYQVMQVAAKDVDESVLETARDSFGF